MGSLYQPGGLVFATQTGTLITPSNLRNRLFKPLLKRAGRRDIFGAPEDETPRVPVDALLSALG